MIIKIIILIISLFVSVFAQTNQWRIVWDQNPENDIDYYEIYIGSDSTNVSFVDTVHYPKTIYTDSLGLNLQGLQPGEIYYYRIKAMNQSGLSSPFSKAAFASIPIITFSELTISVKSDTTFELNQTQFVNDPDHAISLLVWDIQDPIPGDSILHTLINSHTIQLITPGDTTNSDLLVFQVFDPDSFFDERSITINLISGPLPAQAPIVENIPNQTIVKGQTFEPFDLDKYVTDADNDTSELIWTFSGNSILSVQIDSITHIVTISTTDTSWVGSENITFRVTDPNNLYDEYVATFSINLPNNLPPEFTSNPDDTITIAGELYRYTAAAYDPDGDSLVFRLTSGSHSFLDISFINDTSAHIVGTPTLNDTGTYNVTIQVLDGKGGVATQQYDLKVFLSPIEQISEITAYPIPYVLNKSSVKYITFKNAPVGSKLGIYSLLGEPVFSVTVTTEPFLWYINNNSGADVLSGLYIYYIKDSSDKILRSGKLVIIR